MRGSYGRGAAASLALAFLLLACDGSGEPAAREPRVDEDLARVVPDLVDAVQAKQLMAIMDHVDESFAEPGGLDYADVRAIVEANAFREEAVGARLESVSITPAEGGEQRVAARVAFARGTRLRPGEALPPGAVVYAFDLLFAKRDGRWRARTGSYRRE
jgi:hypothetical protein